MLNRNVRKRRLINEYTTNFLLHFIVGIVVVLNKLIVMISNVKVND